MVLACPPVSHSNSSLPFYDNLLSDISIPVPPLAILHQACLLPGQTTVPSMGTQTEILGLVFWMRFQSNCPDRNKECKVLACAFDRSECWGHDCIPLVFLILLETADYPKVDCQRIEAVFKLHPPCISGCLRLLKLRKISQEPEKVLHCSQSDFPSAQRNW